MTATTIMIEDTVEGASGRGKPQDRGNPAVEIPAASPCTPVAQGMGNHYPKIGAADAGRSKITPAPLPGAD